MKARNLLDAAAASYDPPTLKALGQAFDQAWVSIVRTFPADSPVVGHARETLATALLSVAPLHGQNVDALRDAALQVMALNYRDRSGGSAKSNTLGLGKGTPAGSEEEGVGLNPRPDSTQR